jgi:hypothetical protein
MDGRCAMKSSLDMQRQDRQLLRNQWRRRTIRALMFSQVATVLAIGLYFSGVTIYFANFNFGSGGNSQGAIILVAALCLSTLAIIGDTLGILFAWITWRYTGSPWWLVITILLPLFEIPAVLLLGRAL